ncbi:MAG: DUF4830 domain-containing protein [Oscillospiraceae bacterium]
MFIISMKANKKKILAYTFVGLIFLAGLFVYFTTKTAQDVRQSDAAIVTVENNAQRIAYLKTFGWTVAEEAIEICEVAIPAEFDDVYDGYNKLQKEQGFDLETYKGKRVKRFTYEVTNYPNQESDVRANILVYKDKVIAGDVCSLKLDGFMHTLKMQK